MSIFHLRKLLSCQGYTLLYFMRNGYKNGGRRSRDAKLKFTAHVVFYMLGAWEWSQGEVKPWTIWHFYCVEKKKQWLDLFCLYISL